MSRNSLFFWKYYRKKVSETETSLLDWCVFIQYPAGVCLSFLRIILSSGWNEDTVPWASDVVIFLPSANLIVIQQLINFCLYRSL